VVVFDFLGKDSIRYYNEVPVEKRVFKNLQLFMENKKTGDDLFDRLNVSSSPSPPLHQSQGLVPTMMIRQTVSQIINIKTKTNC
jgi:DNA topoisomerase IB